MLRPLSLLCLAPAFMLAATPAYAEQDELLRVPSSGEVRDQNIRDRIKADRLKPGGGLFIMFDTNDDGTVTQAEIDMGIPLAFKAADTNADDYLTAIEQRTWADSLPTRDDSLANPVRFDPNLDRRVDLAEFTAVINALSVDYTNETTGQIMVSDLKAVPKQRRTLTPFEDETARARQTGREARTRGG